MSLGLYRCLVPGYPGCTNPRSQGAKNPKGWQSLFYKIEQYLHITYVPSYLYQVQGKCHTISYYTLCLENNDKNKRPHMFQHMCLFPSWYFPSRLLNATMWNLQMIGLLAFTIFHHDFYTVALAKFLPISEKCFGTAFTLMKTTADIS